MQGFIPTPGFNKKREPLIALRGLLPPGGFFKFCVRSASSPLWKHSSGAVIHNTTECDSWRTSRLPEASWFIYLSSGGSICNCMHHASQLIQRGLNKNLFSKFNMKINRTLQFQRKSSISSSSLDDLFYLLNNTCFEIG